MPCHCLPAELVSAYQPSQAEQCKERERMGEECEGEEKTTQGETWEERGGGAD